VWLLQELNTAEGIMQTMTEYFDARVKGREVRSHPLKSPFGCEVELTQLKPAGDA
jgi:hypothetical protein